MFNKICIKSKKSNDQSIDIGFLIEAMLFYGNVIVLAHKDELIILLKYFGEDFLGELIKIGRVDLKIREDILGSMIFPNNRYNVGLFSAQDETASEILYKSHREIVRNSTKNFAFSEKFSKITEPFRYGNDVTTQIRNEFDNKDLLIKSLPIYLNERVPNFELPKKLELEIVKDENFGPFGAYSLNSNLDLKKLNEIHKENNPDNFHPIDYSGFFGSALILLKL